MNSSTQSTTTTTVGEWRSLFLPLQEKERVIFASFFTPLISVVGDDHHHFSGLNAFHVMNDLSTCQRALLCVLESQGILVFDMCDEDRGPSRVAAFTAVSAPSSSSGAAYSSRHSNATEELITNSSQLNLTSVDHSASTATCAAMIPLSLLHASRSLAANSESALPIRGVMGSSNGRVDVFTERGFVFGFFAHDCPVMQVEALFVGDSVLPPPVPEAPNRTQGNAA
eukprot:CAMPEP_0176451192 /NCGR_PEP_ID=MMETSP0127-20121128/27665_1 /TAXON_ID=938130 /ORGANISM="Platyophrya macrostoma, Strain WH" /LENGTH=225 /DNA_ID=CAMNT_0017839151 /DNA_START=24 /DNA_END=698 /DNA_ORIENTATION=+